MTKIHLMLAAAMSALILASAASADKPATQPVADADVVVDGRPIDRQLPEVKFDKVAFTDAVDFLSDVSGANFVVDWKRLDKAGVKRDTPITLKIANQKFADALKSVLDAAGKGKLAYAAAGGLLIISTTDGAEKIAADIKASKAGWDEKTRQRMSRRLPAVTFDGIALSDALDFFGDVCAAKFQVDWEGFKNDGIDKDSRITAKLRNIEFGDALLIIFQPMAKRPVVITQDKGVLHIAPATQPADPKENSHTK